MAGVALIMLPGGSDFLQPSGSSQAVSLFAERLFPQFVPDLHLCTLSSMLGPSGIDVRTSWLDFCILFSSAGFVLNRHGCLLYVFYVVTVMGPFGRDFLTCFSTSF